MFMPLGVGFATVDVVAAPVAAESLVARTYEGAQTCDMPYCQVDTINPIDPGTSKALPGPYIRAHQGLRTFSMPWDPIPRKTKKWRLLSKNTPTKTCHV